MIAKTIIARSDARRGGRKLQGFERRWRVVPNVKGVNMSGDDVDYENAFKKAKREHDQQREGSTEANRLQAEADADAAVLSDVVLPQLQIVSQKLEPLGGKVEIRQYGRTGKMLRPASVAFRITDRQEHQDRPGYEKGHESRAYLIVPRGGSVTVTSGKLRRDRPAEAAQGRKRRGWYPAAR